MDLFKLFFNDPLNQPQLSTGPSLSSLPWVLFPLSHLSHAVHKGFLTDKLLNDENRKISAISPAMPPSTRLQDTCSLQHPKIRLFQKVSTWAPTATAILCRLSPDHTAGTRPRAGPDTDVTSGEQKGRAELLCSHFPRERTFPQTPVCPEYPHLTGSEDRAEKPGLCHALQARSYQLDKNNKSQVAHQTFDNSVNKTACFFLGTWA